MSDDFYGEPTLAELLEAVREWLQVTSPADHSARHDFDTRVAANILAMAEREVLLGGEHRRRHVARLAALGAADDRELASRIRGGVADDELAAITAALRGAVADRLAVCDPGYPSPRG